MKARLAVAANALTVVLLVPQAFVFFYYFPFLFVGSNPLGLLKAAALYALTVSWVSAPFLLLATALVKGLVQARARWFVTLPLCVAAGYLGLIAWNLLVYAIFDYGRALLPVVLCCLGTAGYAHARAMYLRSLPQEAPKPSPSDGSAKNPSKKSGGRLVRVTNYLILSLCHKRKGRALVRRVAVWALGTDLRSIRVTKE
jgi:hypothetical protein